MHLMSDFICATESHYINFYLTEKQCTDELRLSRQAVTDICRLVSNDVAANANKPYAMPVATKVTAALYFYAGGTFQHPSISSLGGIAQSSVSVAIKQVTNCLIRHAHEFISFPTTPVSQQRVKQQFMETFGFPGVLGAIDCTHIQIRAPAVHGVIYVNRKGTHSINVQVVCDAFQNITNVCAKFPGSSHDAFIMENSVIPAIFERVPPPDGWLIGDNGYPSKTWLLVPYVGPTTARQISFNRKHAQARTVIERTFGTLKQRFRCIDSVNNKSHVYSITIPININDQSKGYCHLNRPCFCQSSSDHRIVF